MTDISNASSYSCKFSTLPTNSTTPFSFLPSAATSEYFLYAHENKVITCHHDTLAISRQINSHLYPIKWICVNNDSNRQLIATYDQAHCLIITDLSDFQELSRFTSYHDIATAAWTHDNRVVYGSPNGLLTQFYPASSQTTTISTIPTELTAIAPFVDNYIFALGYSNGSILIAHLNPSFTILHSLNSNVNHPSGPVLNLSWHAASHRLKTHMLACQTNNHSICVWSIPKHASQQAPTVIRTLSRSLSDSAVSQVETSPVSPSPSWFAWSKQGRIIEYFAFKLFIWDVRTKNVTYETLNPIDIPIAISNYGPKALLFTISHETGIQQFNLDPSTQPTLKASLRPSESPLLAKYFQSLSRLDFLTDPIGNIHYSFCSSKASLPSYASDLKSPSLSLPCSSPQLPPHFKTSCAKTSICQAQDPDDLSTTIVPLQCDAQSASNPELFPNLRRTLSDIPHQPASHDTLYHSPRQALQQVITEIFGWNENVATLVRRERDTHPGYSMGNIILSTWLNEIPCPVSENFDSSGKPDVQLHWISLTLTLLTPHTSKHLANPLLQVLLPDPSSTHVAAAIFLAFADYEKAINLYMTRHYYMEATLLTALYFPDNWTDIVQILRKWGDRAVLQGHNQLALRCFSCSSLQLNENNLQTISNASETLSNSGHLSNPFDVSESLTPRAQSRFRSKKHEESTKLDLNPNELPCTTTSSTFHYKTSFIQDSIRRSDTTGGITERALPPPPPFNVPAYRDEHLNNSEWPSTNSVTLSQTSSSTITEPYRPSKVVKRQKNLHDSHEAGSGNEQYYTVRNTRSTEFCRAFNVKTCAFDVRMPRNARESLLKAYVYRNNTRWRVLREKDASLGLPTKPHNTLNCTRSRMLTTCRSSSSYTRDSRLGQFNSHEMSIGRSLSKRASYKQLLRLKHRSLNSQVDMLLNSRPKSESYCMHSADDSVSKAEEQSDDNLSTIRPTIFKVKDNHEDLEKDINKDSHGNLSEQDIRPRRYSNLDCTSDLYNLSYVKLDRVSDSNLADEIKEAGWAISPNESLRHSEEHSNWKIERNEMTSSTSNPRPLSDLSRERVDRHTLNRPARLKTPPLFNQANSWGIGKTGLPWSPKATKTFHRESSPVPYQTSCEAKNFQSVSNYQHLSSTVPLRDGLGKAKANSPNHSMLMASYDKVDTLTDSMEHINHQIMCTPRNSSESKENYPELSENPHELSPIESVEDSGEQDIMPTEHHEVFTNAHTMSTLVNKKELPPAPVPPPLPPRCNQADKIRSNKDEVCESQVHINYNMEECTSKLPKTPPLKLINPKSLPLPPPPPSSAVPRIPDSEDNLASVDYCGGRETVTPRVRSARGRNFKGNETNGGAPSVNSNFGIFKINGSMIKHLGEFRSASAIPSFRSSAAAFTHRRGRASVSETMGQKLRSVRNRMRSSSHGQPCTSTEASLASPKKTVLQEIPSPYETAIPSITLSKDTSGQGKTALEGQDECGEGRDSDILNNRVPDGFVAVTSNPNEATLASCD